MAGPSVSCSTANLSLSPVQPSSDLPSNSEIHSPNVGSGPADAGGGDGAGGVLVGTAGGGAGCTVGVAKNDFVEDGTAAVAVLVAAGTTAGVAVLSPVQISTLPPS